VRFSWLKALSCGHIAPNMADLIFQKNLQDLIKSIRANKKDPDGLIATSIAEAKNELRSTDVFIKAEAVRKLTYLQMIGYDISWASFAVVEVMSQPRFGHKRIGFLAGNQVCLLIAVIVGWSVLCC
jgi:AP-3 complex subunit delta